LSPQRSLTSKIPKYVISTSLGISIVCFAQKNRFNSFHKRGKKLKIVFEIWETGSVKSKKIFSISSSFF
jgi:hypothetical protein